MSKRKKYNSDKRIVEFMKGVTIAWSVTDPLAEDNELDEGSINHRNRVNAVKLPKMKNLVVEALHEYSYKWHISVDAEFKDKFGVEYTKGYQMVAHSKLIKVNDKFFDIVEKIFSDGNMTDYVTTHIAATILGSSPIKEQDFAA